jgi:predicted XRE-type DNA-binding protein
MKKNHGGYRENAGRKPIQIDWKVARQLAKKRFNQQEIAEWFGVHRSTIRARCIDDNKCDFKDWYRMAD